MLVLPLASAYETSDQTASRNTLTINGYPVKTFSAEWLMREKILSQFQRKGPKEQSDIRDVDSLLIFTVPGTPELDFSNSEELRSALSGLLEKRPEMRQALKSKIKCPAIFDSW
ncbi:hypothetical protein N7535_007659 [Penicillium sp. DV-2018c]|nr:hypothetical protein N7461_003689 [Penicillium sp. DV-2018c]KAJ5566021.1 hypothetical protein N7535_007659 [Penicillium sp. DV-2018c]